MNQNHSLFGLLTGLWVHISKQRRIQLVLLLLLMLATSFTEIVGIGAVLPFLAVLMAPERVYEMEMLKPLITLLGLTTAEQLLLPLTIIFVLAALLAGIMRLLLLWASTRLSFAIGADLSFSIYHRTLYQPYFVHNNRNSSEVINGISTKANGVIYSVIIPILTLISSIIMMISLLAAFLFIEPFLTLFSFAGFGLIYLIIIKSTRNRLLLDSQRVARESNNVIKALQEGLGGIRDVLLDGSQAAYCKIYRSADIPLRRAQGNNLFIGASPRFGMEALGIILIASIAYVLVQRPDGLAVAIPTLGALALGTQRMLPVLQQAYKSWSGIRGGQASLQDTLGLLDQPIPSYINKAPLKPLQFNQSVCLKNLSFRYGPQLPFTLKELDLTITRGERIGIIGETGSGKSTLLDLIMGLLYPSQGQIEVDNQKINEENHRAWQMHIGHVPQSIFLADASIAENIAFGVSSEEIDFERVKIAAQKAQIGESIERMEKQYETLIGERGVRLSGGQRQRIGIARVLYKDADVLVLDEATSALDNATENIVMNAVQKLDKDLTIIIVAHRLSTLKDCDSIIELKDGRIVNRYTYAELMRKEL